MKIHTQIDIDAPIARVWELLVDFDGYSQWNPMILGLVGRPSVGARLRFRLALGRLQVPVRVEVIELMPEQGLRWVGPTPLAARRFISGSHYFHLAPTAAGTRLEHGEEFAGALIPGRWAAAESRLVPAYQRLNVALKRAAEA